MKTIINYSFLIILGLLSCANSSENHASKPSQNIDQLDPIWHNGKAEISSYSLQQNRYNGLHKGEAVMIFVTEPFLTDKQVKNDSGSSKNSVSILKNNQVRRFTTGIYDYSIFTSTFTNPEDGDTYKTSNSSQDWCGQSFMQLNRTKSGYQHELRSYFESEGDQDNHVADAILEDELYNYIRIDESLLPTGPVQILPAAHVSRLLHIPYKAIDATGSIQNYTASDIPGVQLKSYKLEMPAIQRTLEIIYDTSTATREIVGWKDSSPSVFDKEIRTTIATRNSVIWTPYWSQNHVNDTEDREKLLLRGY